MSKQKLHLINSSSNSNYLHIIDNSEQSLIANGDIIVTERTNSSDRPLHCSELAKKLKNRSYNKASGIFVNTWTEEQELESTVTYPNLITKVEGRNYLEYPAIADIDFRTELDGEVIPPNKYYQLNSNLDNTVKFDIEDIEDFYNKLFGTMTGKEICFYNSSRSIINILDNTVMIDLIKPFSDTYTDSISIENILKIPFYDTVSGKLDLTVQYTKEDLITGDISIYSRDLTFLAFQYNNTTSTLDIENFVEDINSDVRLEYIKGVIKVSPLRNDIAECIINKCELTYGDI